MQNEKIYHGGAMRKSAWPSGSGAAGSSYLFDRVWIPATDFKPYPSYPPNGPSPRALPNTIVTYVYQFSPDQLDIIFAWVSLPSRYWTFITSAPTKLRLRPVYYTDNVVASPNNIIDFKAAVMWFPHGYTLNASGPSMTDIPSVCSPVAYGQEDSSVDDFPILNPHSDNSMIEGAFYVKFERVGNSAKDTYSNEAHVLGLMLEFPLDYP